ncbi:MAG TPA: glycerate kinase [Dehalococcoidia bacterium]|nr:glycerate kinase [Dehalococcoidia bacterium]
MSARRPLRILVAPQEFKGTLTARQAADAMAQGVRRALPAARVEALPLADGGPGTVEAIASAAGGRIVTATVQDPLGRPVQADWGLLPAGAAVIETAAACGLLLLTPEERDPGIATTYGVGQLLLAALDTGCRRLLVGLGGSATNDGGAGMAAALGVRFLDAAGRDLPPGGAALAGLASIDASGLDARLSGCETVAASDVANPLCGPEGASLVYAPQKGASPEAARELDAALRRYAEIVERDLGVAVLDAPGAGAAGGLGAGCIAFLRAAVRPGLEVVAEAVGLAGRLRGAYLVVTGEGRLDGQTGFGKTVAGVARLAAAQGVPVLVVPGSLGPGWEQVLPLVAGVEAVAGSAATLADALARPAQLLTLTTERALRGWLRLKEIA